MPQSPAALPQHRVLGLRFASGEIAPWRFRRPSGRGFTEWEPAVQIWTSDPDAYLELAAAGEGICQAGLPHAAPLLSKRVRVVADALWQELSTQPELTLAAATLPAAWHA